MATTTARKAPVTTIKPRYAVVGEHFVGQLSVGEVSLPFRFKTKLLRQVREGGGDSVDQIFTILDGIGDQKSQRQLDECDVIETVQFVNRYFEELAKYQEAKLGELSASQPS